MCVKDIISSCIYSVHIYTLDRFLELWMGFSARLRERSWDFRGGWSTLPCRKLGSVVLVNTTSSPVGKALICSICSFLGSQDSPRWLVLTRNMTSLSITIWRKHGVRSLQPVCVGSNIALVNADPGRACHWLKNKQNLGEPKKARRAF